MIGFAAERLIEMEVSAATGEAYDGESSDRIAQRMATAAAIARHEPEL